MQVLRVSAAMRAKDMLRFFSDDTAGFTADLLNGPLREGVLPRHPPKGTMKTNLTSKIFKPPTLAILTIAIVAAAVAESVMAQGVNQLVFTEDSSTSLTVTYTPFGGSTTSLTVTGGADMWSVSFPSNFFITTASVGWSEPGAIGSFTFANTVFFSFGSVTSDQKNPVTLSDESSAIVGSDANNNLPISATFDDDGDVATVPDAGSTFGLLFLSVIALLGATRFRHVRLA